MDRCKEVTDSMGMSIGTPGMATFRPAQGGNRIPQDHKALIIELARYCVVSLGP